MASQGQRQFPDAELTAFRNFGGMNLLSPRPSLDEGEHAWLENFLPISPRTLTAVPGPDTTLLTIAGKHPSGRQWHMVVAGVNYLIVFVTEGELWAFNLDTGAAAVKISGAFVFSAPDVDQWKSDTIVIADPTSGYCTWDGTTFTQVDATAKQLVAVYAGRVWLISNNTTLTVTAPNSLTDFNVADGAVAAIITYGRLRKAVTRMARAGDYLMLVGDGGVYYISNVQASGVFQLLPAFENHGTTFYGGVDSFDRNLVFAAADNAYLVQGLYPTAIMPQLAPLFALLDLTKGLHISLATVLGVQILLVRATYNDPAGARAIFLCVYQGRCFLLSQADNIIGTCTVEMNNIFYTYATDGTSIYKLFQDATALVSFKAVSRYDDLGNPVQLKLVTHAGVDGFLTSALGSISLEMDTELGSELATAQQFPTLTFTGAGGAVLTFTGSGAAPIVWVSGGITLGRASYNLRGIFIGYTLTGDNPNFSLIAVPVQYQRLGNWMARGN